MLGMDSVFVGDYPYTYVRGLYLLRELIHKEEYHKLMKMSLPEITKYLEESVYKEEIDKLAMKYGGVALLEHAFHLNTVKCFEKLRRISSRKVNLVLDCYLKRMDVYNLKTIIRGKFTKMPDDAVSELLFPIGSMSMEFLSTLIKCNTIRNVLINSNFLERKDAEKAYKEFEKSGNLFELENLLDKTNYNFQLSFSKRIRLKGKKFREFLQSEIYANNLLTIIRLKKSNLGKEYIVKYLIITGSKKMDAWLVAIASLKSLDAILEGISKKDKEMYKALMSVREPNSLVEIEMAIKKYLLRKTLLFQNKYPLSMNIVFGYLLGKEAEIRNLSLIAKGKQFGMDTKLLEGHLVV